MSARKLTLDPAEGMVDTGASVSESWSPSSDITVDGIEPGRGKNTERLRECIRECRLLCWAAVVADAGPLGMAFGGSGEDGTERAPIGPFSGFEYDAVIMAFFFKPPVFFSAHRFMSRCTVFARFFTATSVSGATSPPRACAVTSTLGFAEFCAYNTLIYASGAIL